MNPLLPALLILVLAAPEPDAETLYQQALYRQKILGDREGAVELLARIDPDSAPRPLASRAALQRVVCLHELGRLEEADELLGRLAPQLDRVRVPGLREKAERVRLILRLKIQIRDEDSKSDKDREKIEELERKLEEVLERGRERPTPEPASEPAPGPDAAARMEELRAEKARVPQLFEEALRLEREGDLAAAFELLRRANEIAPENVQVAQALRRIRSHLLRRIDRPDEIRRAVELQRAFRSDLVPRDVDRIYRAARARFHEGDYDAAADLFGAILRLRALYPELADLIVDRVVEARSFLVQAVDRGARPSFLPTGPDGEPEDGWVEHLYSMFRELEEGQETAHRTHTLARVASRARQDAPDVVTGPEPLRLGPAEEYPARALEELLKSRVAPDSWDGADHFIRVVEDWLVVRQTADADERIRDVLSALAERSATTVRVGFELAVLEPAALESLTRSLAVAFESHGPAAAAVLDRAGLARWRAHPARRLGRVSGVVRTGVPLRFDATRPENAVVGHTDELLRERVFNMPVLRTVRRGLHADALVTAGDGGASRVGVEGTVSTISGPYAMHPADQPELRWYSELRRSFALAREVPVGGALLITGFADPYERGGGVLCLAVIPGDTGAAAAGPARGDAVPVGDLAGGEDDPGPEFYMGRFVDGPDRPLSIAELGARLLEARGLEAEERDGALVPAGGRRTDARRALGDLVSRRDDLLEIRARVLAPESEPLAGPDVLPAETGEGGRAWVTPGSGPPLRGTERLPVGLVTAASLQRVHLSRVEAVDYVREYETAAGEPGARPRPVFGRVERGIVLDVRAVADGDAVLVSLLVRTARIESIGEERLPFGADGPPLPVSVPIQVVRGVRAFARLAEGRRLVVVDVPDPFGEKGTTVAVELEVRRISR